MATTLNSNDEFVKYKFISDLTTISITTAFVFTAVQCRNARSHQMMINCTNMASVGAWFSYQMQATLDSVGSSNWFSISQFSTISAFGVTGVTPNIPNYQNSNVTYEAVRMQINAAGTTGAQFQVWYYGV